MTLDKLIAGKTYDLHGQTVHLGKSLYVPPGRVTVCNGKIDFQGNGATVGSASMSAFYTDAKSGQLHVENVQAIINDHCSVAHTDTGGRVSLRGVVHTAGAICWSMGGELVEITNCYSTGTPAKYWFCNFTHLLKVLRIDNSICTHPIKQGKTEAAIRCMQIDDAIIEGISGEASEFKQFAQSRPGGSGKKNGAREHFKQHIWRRCRIKASASKCFDGGNFKDETDVNFPFGTLDLLRIEDCDLGGFELTTQGANHLTWDQMGVRRVEIVNTKLGGVMTNETITH